MLKVAPCTVVRSYGRTTKFLGLDGLLLFCIVTPLLEWFSKRTGTSFQNGARSKNVDKKLGRERRRVENDENDHPGFIKITITFEFSVLIDHA